ncbi:MAG: hypothetical protein RL177_542 [Bacteroidota bacterium]|jgi:hypothetical protein
MIITGWGQPPPAGSVLVPTDAGLIGYGIARTPPVAKQRALEDASANRFLSVRFETFMQGTGYAYSFDEFAIEDPAKPDHVSVVDSTRRADGLLQFMVAYPDTSAQPRNPAEEWTMTGSYRAIRGDEYRSYAMAKRQAVRAMVEARYKSVKVMDQMTMERMERVAYLSTKAIIRNIRVLEVTHRADSTVVRIAIHPRDVFFYE